MIHYVWYNKISLAYKLSIIDEILLCYFDALYQGLIIEKTVGSTIVRFVGDPRRGLLYWGSLCYDRFHLYSIPNKNTHRSTSLQDVMQACRAKPAVKVSMHACLGMNIHVAPCKCIMWLQMSRSDMHQSCASSCMVVVAGILRTLCFGILDRDQHTLPRNWREWKFVLGLGIWTW
jgi:hypothetical protein